MCDSFTLQGEKVMMNDFEDVNRILAEMRDAGMVEPIDDGSLEVHFHEWAEVVGVVDEFYPEYDCYTFEDDGTY
jgi:hypothetical protein